MFSSLYSIAFSRYASSMQVGDEAFKEFMALYQAEFGKEISRQDALEMTTRLINFYLIIYRPLPSERGDRTMLPSENHRDPDASFPTAE